MSYIFFLHILSFSFETAPPDFAVVLLTSLASEEICAKALPSPEMPPRLEVTVLGSTPKGVGLPSLFLPVKDVYSWMEEALELH